MWKTLRFRLAVWNVCVVALTALATLAGLREGVRRALLHEMDQNLTEDTQEVALALHQHPASDFEQLTRELTRKALGHRHHGWFVQLFARDGAIVWSSPDTPPSATREIPLETAHLSVDGHRLVSRDAGRTPAGIAAIRVGASLSLLHEDMARIDRLVMLAAGLLLIVAPLVGYWLAGRAARTIGAITETAEKLRPSHLEERLPIQGTGDELDRLALTINGLLDRIAEDLQRRRDFLADAAHELRTPLAAIHSSVEVALGSDRSRDEYQDLLIEVIDQSTTLETLVNQLLLLVESEAERLKMDHEPVRLDEVVRRSADMFAGVAEAGDVRLSLDVDSPVLLRGNRHLLRQLVNNLIDNAVKYTPAGGHVAVRLMVDDDQNAVLAVNDTGIGIAEGDVPKVFDRFFRADKSRTRMSEAAGTGLGLSICNAVTAAHGGRIHCRSRLQEGTYMEVILPMAAAVPPGQSHRPVELVSRNRSQTPGFSTAPPT